MRAGLVVPVGEEGAATMTTPRIPTITDWAVTRGLLGKYKINFECPHCHTELHSPEDDIGQRDSCPTCRLHFSLSSSIAEEIAADREDREDRAEEKQRMKEDRAEEKQRMKENRAKENRRQSRIREKKLNKWLDGNGKFSDLHFRTQFLHILCFVGVLVCFAVVFGGVWVGLLSLHSGTGRPSKREQRVQEIEEGVRRAFDVD
jgi:uncharacterized Zn finger protein (UPF0148 family)